MKINTAKFRTSAATFETCPESTLPEFAFVGRSNVGKSSLINMLTGKKELAKTSGVPGKTQLINFFDINELWSLVDLPGYGYARVSKAQQRDFNVNVSAYLTQRENLKHIFALVDSQLEPQESDLAFIEWMQSCGLSYSVIFTKTDKSSEHKVANHGAQFLEQLVEWKLQPEKSFHCSAKANVGKGPILQFIGNKLPKKVVKKEKSKLNLNWMKLK